MIILFVFSFLRESGCVYPFANIHFILTYPIKNYKRIFLSLSIGLGDSFFLEI